MIFATDLDRTIIYSKSFLENIDNKSYLCVEHRDKMPISYMTKDSIKLIEEIKNKVNFVPVTSRSLSEYNRVSIVEDCKNFIVANGGIIYINNQRSKIWDRYVAEQYIDINVKLILNKINESQLFTKEAKFVDNSFIFTKTDKKKESGQFLYKLLKDSNLIYYINGHKVYIFNKKIQKENALKFLIKSLHDNIFITAGDSNIDCGILNLGQTCLYPKHGTLDFSKLNNKNYLITKEQGLKAGEEILKEVIKIIENSTI